MTNNISKERFLLAMSNNRPNVISKITFKYFSKSTTKEDKWLKKCVSYTLFGAFLMSFFLTILNIKSLIAFFTYFYSIGLGILILFLSAGLVMNNIRLNKIRKELGISKEEFNVLSIKYSN